MMRETPPPRKRPSPVNPRHPARLLYLALAALAVGVLENEIQAFLGSGPGAIWDGDWDFAQVQQTWFGHLALAYPLIFWPLVALCLLLAVLGWWLDHRLKTHADPSPFTPARSLEADTFPMGDPAAARFPYLAGPVQAPYDEALAALRAAALPRPTKRGLLVLGKANTGKTRLAYEALTHALPTWDVYRAEPAQQLADLPNPDAFAGNQVVIFVDDVQTYAGGPSPAGGAALAGPAATLLALWSRAKSSASRTLLLATCRAEDLDAVRASLPWLFTELASVAVPLFTHRRRRRQADPGQLRVRRRPLRQRRHHQASARIRRRESLAPHTTAYVNREAATI